MHALLNGGALGARRGIKLKQTERAVRHPNLVRSDVQLPHSKMGRLCGEHYSFFKLAQRLFVFDDFRYVHQNAALTDWVAVPIEFDAPTTSDPPNSAIA